jgi:hypothetical protein
MSKINQNNDISVYRGETAAIDFKISQRSDYYVPFLISSERVNPMVCITIGSTRRENNNIVSKQLWLELDDVPKFTQTVVRDLGEVDDTDLTTAELKVALALLIAPGEMTQFTRKTEADPTSTVNSQLHFAYSVMIDEVETVYIDEYDFTVTMSLNETITLDMTNTDYFYQIELMDTVPMMTELESIFATTSLYAKLPNGFTTVLNESGLTTAITEYKSECIALATKLDPTRWGYRVLDPLTSPVASVSNIQMLQAPRRFTVQSVVK